MIMMLTTPSRIVHTADALRLLVIARYGGFYSDTDVVFIRFFHRDHADDDDDDDDDDDCGDDVTEVFQWKGERGKDPDSSE